MTIIQWKIDWKKKCPVCNKTVNWANDIPLKYFCWGPLKKEHKEWSEEVPYVLIEKDDVDFAMDVRKELI